MYHTTPRQLLIAAAMITTLAVHANTAENFNSRNGISLKQVKSTLQSSCWTFHQFDINQNNWNPRIEGDGAMVSTTSALESGNSGIYTPLLKVNSRLDVSFNYRFNRNFDEASHRWMKICLADANNKVVQVLEEISINGVNATRVVNYSTEFINIVPGEYRLVLLYGGSGGSSRIAVDEIITSAPYLFQEGCSLSPSPLAREIAGTYKRTAAGSLLSNNSTRKQQAFLVKDSEDGRVELFPDGTFVFIPDNGFRGQHTSFLYRLCYADEPTLCSDSLSLKINFPDNALSNFHGFYKLEGNVELAWKIENGTGIESVELERSTDGHNWKRAAVINAKLHDSYTFTDNVGKNKALKNDLYYRLRQTDDKGKVNTSKTMVVRVYNTSTLNTISVSPEPAKKEIWVNVLLKEDCLVSLRVIDPSGKTVLHQLAQAGEGMNTLPVKGSGQLTPGNYMLEVVVNSKERMMVKLEKE